MPRFSTELLDHAQSPRNTGELPGANAVGTSSLGGNAPYLVLYLKVTKDCILEARFKSFGCAVLTACGSVLTEMVSGQPIEMGRNISEAEIKEALEGIPLDKQFCATLAIRALQDALE
jgi:NifU-like protein involved in Fe-S cluster formation